MRDQLAGEVLLEVLCVDFDGGDCDWIIVGDIRASSIHRCLQRLGDAATRAFVPSSPLIVKFVCRSLFVIFDRLPFRLTLGVLGFMLFSL